MQKAERLDFIGAFERAWFQYRSNFKELLIWGFVFSLPPIVFYFDITAGVVFTILFGGFSSILLANAVMCASKGVKNDAFSSFSSVMNFLKNGFLISVLLFPLLIIGTVLLLIPSVALFSVFMFSFFSAATDQKFAVDALIDSLRMGNGSRLPLFLFAFIFYAAVAFLLLIFQIALPLGFIASGCATPYFFSVIYEFYYQLETKR